jgi:hypothetical protein
MHSMLEVNEQCTDITISIVLHNMFRNMHDASCLQKSCTAFQICSHLQGWAGGNHRTLPHYYMSVVLGLLDTHREKHIAEVIYQR